MPHGWIARVSLFAWAGASMLVGQGLGGRVPTARAQAGSPPAFPSQASVVTVDVVVVDAKGQSIEGLTKDDFSLEEDGKPQTIVNFEAVSVPAEAAAGATTPADSGPIVTNSGAEETTGRAFALLADDLSFPGEQSLQIRQTLTRFINESLGPGDTAILGTTSGDTWWRERVPEGRADLLAAVERVKGRYADPRLREHMTEYEAYWITHREGGTAQRSEKLADAMQRPSSVSERVVIRMWEENLCGQKGGLGPPSADACWPTVMAAASDIDATRSQRTSQALQAMSRALAALAPSRGRKSLVFVSPGFIQDSDLALQDVASAALQAHTSLYFVDARGLVAETGGGSAAERTRQSPSPDRKTATRLEDIELASGGAQALAEQTGGFSVRNTNDLAGATARIAVESRTYYLLGFAPPAGKAPTAWRKLRVEVKRSGVTTRARRGYRLDQATTAAMARTGTGTPIPLRMATYVLEPSSAGSGTRVVAATEIDTSGLAANAAPGDDTPPLELRVEATPRDGGDPQVQDVSLQSSRANPQAAARPGANWRLARLEFALPPGIHAIRAFVQDPVSGRTGVVEQRLDVPAPSGLRLSTPVLSDLVTASRDATGTPFPAPVAHDEFKADPGRPLLVTVEVFGAAKDAASGKTNVESRLVLQTRAGKALAAPPSASLAAAPDGRLRQVVALPQLPGGEYELAITMEDRVAKAKQEVRRTFRVDAPNPPATPAAPVASVSAAPPVTNPELAAVLERAGKYVLAYGKSFSNITAEEECRQIFEPNAPERRAVRNTRASVFFITLLGPVPWTTFRDVFEVDGNKIHDRGEALGRLFRDATEDARARTRAILEASARYNLGPVQRNQNIPTLALLFLHPDNQRRFAFELKGKPGTPVVEVAFDERARPTLVGGETSDGAPVKGRLWIERDTGKVMKTDADYDFDPRDTYHRSRARIVTEYRREPSLDILVPDRMKETYTSLAVQWQQRQVLSSAHDRVKDPQEESGVFTTEATSTYSAYARFEVTTNETFTPKKPD